MIFLPAGDLHTKMNCWQFSHSPHLFVNLDWAINIFLLFYSIWGTSSSLIVDVAVFFLTAQYNQGTLSSRTPVPGWPRCPQKLLSYLLLPTAATHDLDWMPHSLSSYCTNVLQSGGAALVHLGLCCPFQNLLSPTIHLSLATPESTDTTISQSWVHLWKFCKSFLASPDVSEMPRNWF